LSCGVIAPVAFSIHSERASAAHPLEDERRFREIGGQRWLRPQLGPCGGGRARFVIRLESGAGDGARHGFAPGAAELALGAEDGGAVRARVGQRRAAMETSHGAVMLGRRVEAGFDLRQRRRRSPG